MVMSRTIGLLCATVLVGFASMNPLRAADEPKSESAEPEPGPRERHFRGEEFFRAGKVKDSVREFDREIELVPQVEAGHWQRGISLYYAGEYERGAKQFDLHQTVNPEDVENAAWHFLCAVRSPGGSIDKARKNLISVTDDPRVPMKEVQQMFAGMLAPSDVLSAAKKNGSAQARFYADLYVGLYYEAEGKPKESLDHIEQAAQNPASQHYMGDVARVHFKLRSKERDDSARGSK